MERAEDHRFEYTLYDWLFLAPKSYYFIQTQSCLARYIGRIKHRRADVYIHRQRRTDEQDNIVNGLSQLNESHNDNTTTNSSKHTTLENPI